VRALHAALPPPPKEEKKKPATNDHPLGWEAFWPWVMPLDGLSFGAYVQAQYETHQDSEDQLLQGGTLGNKDRYSIRRARVSLLGEWEYAAVALEVDANTTSGPQVDLRKAEASLQYRPDRKKPPMIMATLGQFDTPFGYELVESPRTRWFMERSVLSRAFWPGEPDLGLRLAGALGFFRWTIASINGNPLGESTPYALQDPLAAKDVVFRFGIDASPREDLQIAGGISATRGKGFHAGTDATKSGLQWVDINGDGMVQLIELQPIIGRAATPSQSFDRWAAGADIRVNARTPIGVTKVYAEIVAAANMDRGLFVADPIAAGADQRELGFYAGVVQEICHYGVVGFRFDMYDPNSDALDKRAGQLLPYSQVITTASPLIGLMLPDGRARLALQYDIIHNGLARDSEGVPTNLKENTLTLRLQVQP
jgi:phosphate-selective porin O/P